MFSISGNSPPSRVYVLLVVSLPCSSVHCWHSCLLMKPPNTFTAYPYQIINQLKSHKKVTINHALCHVCALPAAEGAVGCPQLSAPAHLCRRDMGSPCPSTTEVSQAEQCLQDHSKTISASQKSP